MVKLFSPTKHHFKEADNKKMPYLPNEIIVEILLRLPAKSLCRFRCVSKPWRILISDPEFVKKHLNLVKKHEPISEAMRVMIHYTSYDIKSCSLLSLINGSSCSAVELYHPHKNLRHNLKIVGSCNGLVCFCLEKQKRPMNMFIWNPTTRECKTLPLPFSMSYCFSGASMYGFGYDCSTNDYKVVMNHRGFSKSRWDIYSLKTDSWKRIGHFNYENIQGSGKVVNGAFHWVGTRIGQSRRGNELVLSLDFVDLVLKEVPQPNNYGYGFTSIYVQVIGESLSVFSNRSGHSLDVWIMKEYGVKESWIKLVSIPYTPEMHGLYCNGSCCTSKYILMYCSTRLVIYDLDQKNIAYPMIDGEFISREVEIFTETLVSPNAYGGQDAVITDSELESRGSLDFNSLLGFELRGWED